jgi:hypothetical protein
MFATLCGWCRRCVGVRVEWVGPAASAARRRAGFPELKQFGSAPHSPGQALGQRHWDWSPPCPDLLLLCDRLVSRLNLGCPPAIRPDRRGRQGGAAPWCRAPTRSDVLFHSCGQYLWTSVRFSRSPEEMHCRKAERCRVGRQRRGRLAGGTGGVGGRTAGPGSRAERRMLRCLPRTSEMRRRRVGPSVIKIVRTAMPSSPSRYGPPSGRSSPSCAPGAGRPPPPPGRRQAHSSPPRGDEWYSLLPRSAGGS